ncbi:nSTAND1 domain-containing NTPase [Phormidesmis priestleyi]|nr:caspase family protein [Phormidesmis priestleyi]
MVVMGRDALVVGINLYDCEQLSNLKAPAEDAEAIAQCLTQSGGFRVRRLPEVIRPETQATRVGRKTKVTLTQLEEALVQLFKPTGNHIPETALFYFSGHGLRKDRGIQEGFLATSDVSPNANQWGLRLKWLRELLQESPIRQQIIWLDCCYSGELLNFKENLEEADPGSLEQHDRCFIAASREYEVAYEETAGSHGVLTGALLQALDPQHRSDGLVTNFTLTEQVNQALKSASQRPLFANFGNKIILTGQVSDRVSEATGDECPYRGLAYFDRTDQDARFFYGRTALTDVLLERVRDRSFVAVVGASGSGKSSVVRAGLLHQLKLGQRISGSHLWTVYVIRPGDKPRQSLAEAFLEPGLSAIDRADQLHKAQALIDSGAVGFAQLIAACESDRVVLVIDQFEECFTLCRDETERQQFFEGLLGAIQQLGKKLCLVITLRADFFSKCLQYPQLAQHIENNLVAVKPMNREELAQAIVEPAKQVNLDIEAELVTQMILDVESSPGSLPLLQYTLTELWKRRSVNWLTLAAYNRMGGVRGTLQQRADEVYASLSPQEQETARRIFLELTQLGEGTEDTRRQVLKRDLITSKQSELLIDRVIQRLSTERLVVTSELVERSAGNRVQVIDVAHEALIRYWSRLRQWIEENRLALKQKRTIEDAAEDWVQQGKPVELAYLLQGSKLAEAENFLQVYADTMPLSSLAQEFIQLSQAERDRLHRQEQVRKRWKTAARIAFPTLIAISAAVFGWQQQRAKEATAAVFLAGNVPESISQLSTALPTFREEARALKAKAESGKEADISLALAYYRRLRETAIKLLNLQKQTDSKTLSELQLKQLLNTQAIAAESDKSLAELIEKYRFPALKQQLNTQNFGERLPNTQFTDFENQYTGALRTTYQILMGRFGAGADLNQDGRLTSIDEREQLPCDTLLELDRLWREATRKAKGKACGWYGANFAVFENLDCATIPKFEKRTLAFWIFDTDYDSAIERIKTCRQPSQARNL